MIEDRYLSAADRMSHREASDEKIISLSPLPQPLCSFTHIGFNVRPVIFGHSVDV